MNEDYWYYEERSELLGSWLDVFAGRKMKRDESVKRMEARKKAYPDAKLRLVHVTRERFSYRNRKAAK